MVIKKLTDKIAAAKDQAAEIKNQEAAYQKEVQKWTKECDAIIRKNSVGIGDIDNYFNYKTDGKYYIKVQYLLDAKIVLPEKRWASLRSTHHPYNQAGTWISCSAR